MCQLIMVSSVAGTTREEEDFLALTKKILLYVLLTEDSRTVHKDGCGFFEPGTELFKTKLSADRITNLGGFIKEILGNNTVIGHVRAASFRAKRGSDDDSHPFEGKYFVLAHNGTLEPVDKKSGFDISKQVDSEFFLEKLEEEREKNPDEPFEKLLKKVTEEQFRGKFAFMIYEKSTKNFYVARGKTALLHKVELLANGKKVLVVNTEYTSFEQGLVLAKNILKILGIELEYKLPESLEVETIWKVNSGSMEKLGKIKEVEKEVAVAASPRSGWDAYNTVNLEALYLAGTEVFPEVLVQASVIVKLMIKMSLSIQEIDHLCCIAFKKPLCYLSKEDSIELVKFIQELEKRWDPQSLRLWGTLRNSNTTWGLYKEYSSYGLQFPYFMTDKSVLKEIVELDKAKRERSEESK